jgi:hypothetical protein
VQANVDGAPGKNGGADDAVEALHDWRVSL